MPTMRVLILLTTVFTMVAMGTGFIQVNDEMRLAEFLVSKYPRAGRLGRPVANVSDKWNVTLGLSLLSMPSVDSHYRNVEVVVWQTMTWRDVYLKWSQEDFAVSNVRLLPTQIAIPDITLYNVVARPEVLVPEPMVVVNSEGEAFYVPPIKYRFTCPVSTGTKFTCSMKFGSWTYNGHQLNLTMHGVNIDMEQYTPAQYWKVLGTTATRNEVMYECCNEPYIDITYNITMKN